MNNALQLKLFICPELNRISVIDGHFPLGFWIGMARRVGLMNRDDQITLHSLPKIIDPHDKSNPLPYLA